MSLQLRLVLATGSAVLLAVVAALLTAYSVDRSKLRGQIDSALTTRASQIEALTGRGAHRPYLGISQEQLQRLQGLQQGGPAIYAQAIDGHGRALARSNASLTLPVTARSKEVAEGHRTAYFSDVDVANSRVRLYTFPLGNGIAVELARPLAEIDAALADIRLALGAIAAAGVALALVCGWLVARAALRPVRRLTSEAEEIAVSPDLRRRANESRTDDLGRLARAFNAMLGALEQNVRSQRQLVADASHELRTPLTSIHTNLEVLSLDEQMPIAERRQLVDQVLDELAEMRSLVGELMELARGEVAVYEFENVRFDLVVEQAVARLERDASKQRFVRDLEPTVVRGAPSALERAVHNLLDNARKWNPPDEPVEISLHDGVLSVRDHGPGIPEQDLPRVFERFYRAPSARDLPGSGLGLAIVHQIVTSHHGQVSADLAEGGGTVMRLALAPVDGVDEAVDVERPSTQSPA